MSDTPQKQNTPNASEEVDIIALFSLIGSVFTKFFRFIGSIFKAVFVFVIIILKALIGHYKIIVAVMVLAAGLGYGLERNQQVVYSSKMLVRPYFDSKYQLVANIDYYNTLIATKNYGALSKTFSIEESEVKHLQSFTVDFGSESENDRVQQYGRFIKNTDSTSAQMISYSDFIENRSIFTGEIYEIKVEALKADIFKSLEPGLSTAFSNEYSNKKRQKRDSLFSIKKKNLLASIGSVDSLQSVYSRVMESEAKSSGSKLSLGEMFSVDQEKNGNTELDLLNKEIQLRNELEKLEAEEIEEDAFFDVISGFKAVGDKNTGLSKKYTFVFPLYAFAFLCLFYIAFKSIKFVNEYEV